MPTHLFDTLDSTLKIAPKSSIIFLSREKNEVDFYEQLKARLGDEALRVKFIATEAIPEGLEFKIFKEKSSLNKEFRDGFWFNASARFFVLADYLRYSRIENVIHIENDYVLNFDPTDKIKAFKSYSDFSVPIDRVRAIPGIVWIKNSNIAEKLAAYIAKNSHQDDMTSVGSFCYENQNFAKPLPTIPQDYANEKGLNVKQYSVGIELFGGIFDAAAIGQFIGGVHWVNSLEDTTFFQNESSDLKLQDFIFSWDSLHGARYPVLLHQNERTRVLGLHAHSKEILGVSPFNTGLPLDEKDIITGERIQALCNLTIGSPSITKFHGRDNIQTKELIEIPEQDDGRLLPPTEGLIESVDQARTIFIYTHLIPYFKYYIAPRLTNEFTLVTHNSDYSVTVLDLPLLNHPKLKAWFGQNCEISHAKLHALPLGLENKQWGEHKIPELVNKSKAINKLKLAYVNFSERTHPTRKEAFLAVKGLSGATIEHGKSYSEYLQSLTEHKFCLCPRGNGIDTHRFWEAQFLDSIPVILWRDWTAAYSEMPLLILDQWSDIKKIDLEKSYIMITNKKYSRKNLSMKFIREQILGK